MKNVASVISNFVFYYPLLMSYLWMMGGLLHYFLVEHKERGKARADALPDCPKVSVIVPCYNEADNVREVMASLARLRYPNYNIIAVNDGSSDATGEILNELTDQYPQLLVIHQSHNEGKAIGLTTAAMLTDAEYLLCIDGDSLLDRETIGWMLRHFLRDPDVAGVTGNPRIRTRTSLLGRMQVGEFSSIVGLIKRTQEMYGRLLTVSGVICMFRKSALRSVGYWSPDMLTEDIDISWKLQVSGWRIHFEPHALSWILMPETFKGLFRQRLRWAKGGIQVLQKYAVPILRKRATMMWPIFLEYAASVLWAYCMLFTLVMTLANALFDLPPAWHFANVPRGAGIALFLTCCAQIVVGCLIDRHYDTRLLRYFLNTIWYPVAFWTIGMVASVIALPSVLLHQRGSRARWVSPDRGIREGAPSQPTSPAPASPHATQLEEHT
ncbi:poly-beta-1,6 N-acetyl-D-glucosamine synthase [Cupriavidus sp. USMAA2-4]|uniref:Poly-beta-1,6-N-acetyl-D-glucosamine synthase n=1 Tax=Cupriavidus malaysiensis TaxID=367825 RepID=A0A1D9IA20_9BURK|nr:MULTISPECIES: poly-beta-1,6-N-acetyl-D-glucosamine synthase [Cupriavidus]AOY95809.1 poly-beta-1,6 N-acetyl-D-glucosamine synthase [Cupriavidus sp. USMAA2-4]AOZ08959.1 poly-beta-1,6 N-acetyl-D-glucosamine synthase [Cupriavidus malaysiensis]